MSEPFKIEPRVADLIKRGQIKKQASAKISKRIDTLVARLRKRYPSHDDTICRLLDGVSARLRSENEMARRAARDKAIKDKA